MKVNLEPQTLIEVVDVADWYGISPQDYVRMIVSRDLDRVMEEVNPQLDCWLGRSSNVHSQS